MKLTKKQQLITEFFDFYSINELYLRCGGFRDIGYKGYSTFVSARAEEKIKAAYEQVVNNFYKKVYDALVASVKSELRHFRRYAFSPVGYADGVSGLYRFFKDTHGLTKEKIDIVRKNPDLYPETAHLLFNGIKWNEDYGGESWAKGTQALIDSQMVKTTEDKVLWIDKVMDLQHNNGHMLDKTDFCALSEDAINLDVNLDDDLEDSVDTTPLDVRANARNIMVFIPLNSPRVAKLVIPQKNKLTFK